MCVIVIASLGRPSAAMIDACYQANAEGAGIAWRDPDDPTLVRWEKGLDLHEIQDLAATLPLPYIAHFRIASVGGGSKKLCHPFEVSEDSSPEMSGATKNPLLFHNGTWTEWRRTMFETVYKMGVKVPNGRWSDSRAMAWLGAIFGTALYDIIDEKVATISPEKLEVFGQGWVVVPGVGAASNSGWQGRMKGASPSRLIEPNQPEPEEASAIVPFDPKTSPFEMATELYAKGEISRKQFRKAHHFHLERLKDPASQPTTH